MKKTFLLLLLLTAIAGCTPGQENKNLGKDVPKDSKEK
jgi:hypothetical protein